MSQSARATHPFARSEAIARYRLDWPGQEPTFDHAVQLAVNAFDVPISLVSIVGADLQCFKGKAGLDADQTPRDISLCAHALLADDIFVIEDALVDERFADNPQVIGDPSIRFYAGAPLRLKDGLVPGTLCLIDHRPRTLNEKGPRHTGQTCPAGRRPDRVAPRQHGGRKASPRA